MYETMNIPRTGAGPELAQAYLDSFAQLARDIAEQYVEVPAQLRVKADRLRLVLQPFKPKPLIGVCFTGEHAKVDHGKLIGKHGKHFAALQTILRHYGDRFKTDVKLSVNDPGGRFERGKNGHPDPNWNRDEEFREHLASVCERVFGYPVSVRAVSKWDITHLIIETSVIEPELLSAFEVLWVAIGRNNGRQFKLSAEAPKEQAV